MSEPTRATLRDDEAIKVQDLESLGEIGAETLVGKVVHAAVDEPIPEEGVSWFGLFRFARVRAVRRRALRFLTACRNCGSRFAHYSIEVEWEAGYVSPHGTTLCERCLDGVVTAGLEHISFGESAPPTDSS